ncbi:hypothetical protein NEOLI_003670 [Neolecta irregularis DAH-3]|uniref:Mediator of RNA polymerase II transcription subunit 11 n=1 Tax=Neolecta irregularis (strain DAH-3) TaxID=1198029 RepID=A0A1U7LPD1_NEOID|nr:hypothetical protein NEOLI_003670 [Neolecta irregularis DAH-3]|eukprot:OLL24402.1 hypothetical protein NEOLI_003670 [Neolecta irregularis DAH-3]
MDHDEPLIEISTSEEAENDEIEIDFPKPDNIEQIKLVMEIEKVPSKCKNERANELEKIPELLNYASLAIQMLQSKQLANETTELRKSKFEQHSESYMNLLEDISVGLSQQIINLQKSKIQPRPITKIPIDPYVKIQQRYWEEAKNLIVKFKEKNANQNVASS